jgi:hypothetical protein
MSSSSDETVENINPFEKQSSLSEYPKIKINRKIFFSNFNKN